MSLKHRLTRVEATHLYHLAAESGRPYGLTAEEERRIVEAGERVFFQRPPEEEHG
jgi:hypothetical protein